MESDQLRSMLNSNPELDVYRHLLENMIRQKEHILSPEMEELMAQAGPAMGSPSRIFNMIDDADMKYGTILDEDGNEVELSKQRYGKFLESTDRRVRKDAAGTYNQAYLDRVNALAATLEGSIKRDYFYAKARGYETCLDMALESDNVPREVFTSLVAAVNNNLAPLHKWVSIRKKLMQLDTLYKYDMWVPVMPEMKREVNFEDAKRMLVEGLEPMGDQYLGDFAKGLESGWIDVYETRGKASGAYNWGTYNSHPYILMNWSDQLNDVFTLAHEMGHAMHAYYTNRNEPYRYGGHSLFVAEVASTLNEAVLMKYLLGKIDSREEKIALLNYYIEQIIGTFYTQVMFSEFEQAVHERIESGEAFSADYFRGVYREIYEKYYGPELVLEEMDDLGCLRISHFYRQFYVYKYATSYAAAQMLSQTILNDEEGAMDRYLNFLSTGTSKYPIDILKDAGVDMTTTVPVDRTLALFADLVDQMEVLLFEEG
jgi:oligoendopeptidase F